MCGICGMMRLGDAPPFTDADQPQLDRMTDTLTHRGPNDRGTYLTDRVALGSRRLSVIDLSSAGRQPMGNERGTVQIALNGEIYNFRTLKQRYDLEGRGHVFRSRTDTEVLVHLYEEIGLDMLPQLNGMFGMALWDAERQTLHLIRDPFGVKPLFYHRDAGVLRFGSEIKAILADARVPRRPSLQALHDYLTFDYVPGAQTAFEDIFEVPPGHCMSVSADGQMRLLRFWDLRYETDDSIDENTAVARARELMDQAVDRQLIADVPVGVLLSGGMDSSAITALMARRRAEPVHTYSVGFEDGSFNELPYARMVAQAFGTIAREVVVTPQLVRSMLPKYLTFIDEPYADGSAIPTYFVCQLARDEVVVVLSGEGGDEAFTGYETHAAYKVARFGRMIPRWLRRGVLAPVVGALPVSHKKLSLEFKLKRFLGGLDLPPVEAHLWWRIVLTEQQKRRIYSRGVQDRLAELQEPQRHFHEVAQRAPECNGLNRLLHIDNAVFLPDDLMVKNDRMSMAHSLEARVPMCDPDLAQFMATVPPHVKLPGLRKKHVMRRAMEGILPPAILRKKKVGLEMPYSRWLKHELRDLVDTYLARDRVEATGLFAPAGTAALVDEHMTGRFDHGRALWGLLNYMMWHDLYIA